MPPDDVLVEETLDRLILDSIQLQLASRYRVRIRINSSMNHDQAGTAKWTHSGTVPTALEQSGQSYAIVGTCAMTWQFSACNRNVMKTSISEQEIDNFLSTEEGEAMSNPNIGWCRRSSRPAALRCRNSGNQKRLTWMTRFPNKMVRPSSRPSVA